MTVEQLIVFLKTCPQDAVVDILVEHSRCYETFVSFEEAFPDDIDVIKLVDGPSYVQLGRRA